MAWSPHRRTNAGIVWVSAPGDYATFNSNQIPDGTVGPRRSGISEVEHFEGPGFMPVLPLALRAAAAHVPVHEALSVPDEFIARTQPDYVRRDLHRLVQLKGMQRLFYPRLVVEQHVTIDQSHILHIRNCG